MDRGAPAGRWEGCSLCSGIHFFALVALWGNSERPKVAGTVLRGAPGAFPGALFGFSKAPGMLFRRSGRVYPGLPIVSEAVWGVAEMIRHGFTVRLDICGWNLRAPLSIADCMGLLFGVGGSGRSPVEFSKWLCKRNFRGLQLPGLNCNIVVRTSCFETPLRHASKPCGPFLLCMSASCCVPGPP